MYFLLYGWAFDDVMKFEILSLRNSQTKTNSQSSLTLKDKALDPCGTMW